MLVTRHILYIAMDSLTVLLPGQ